MKKEEFLHSVAYRYFMLLASFVVGVGAVACLPVAVSLNPVFHVVLALLSITSFFIYVARSMMDEEGADVEAFVSTKGYAEFVVGFLVGAEVAYEIIIGSVLAPGALVAAAAGCIAVIAGLAAYVSISVATGQTSEFKGIRSYAEGLVKSFFSILVAALVVSLIGFLTGVPMLAFGVELVLSVVFSLMLLGNMITIYEEQAVVISGFSGTITKVSGNPAYCALLLFANTIDLFVSLFRMAVFLNSDKKEQNWEGLGQVLIGFAFVFGAFKLVQALASDTFKAQSVKETFAAPPSYEQSVRRDYYHSGGFNRQQPSAPYAENNEGGATFGPAPSYEPVSS